MDIKTLDQIKWDEIDWIKCGIVKSRAYPEPVLACTIKTIDNQIYQFTTKKYMISPDSFLIEKS